MRRRQSPRLVRYGLSSMEVVLATAITLPVLAVLLHIGFLACRRLYHVIGTLVGWPYL